MEVADHGNVRQGKLRGSESCPDVTRSLLTFSSAAQSASPSSRNTPLSSAAGSAPAGPSRC